MINLIQSKILFFTFKLSRYKYVSETNIQFQEYQFLKSILVDNQNNFKNKKPL